MSVSYFPGVSAVDLERARRKRSPQPAEIALGWLFEHHPGAYGVYANFIAAYIEEHAEVDPGLLGRLRREREAIRASRTKGGA